jgi:hypothetical protein
MGLFKTENVLKAQYVSQTNIFLIFRMSIHLLDNVLVTDLKHVRFLTLVERSAECETISNKGSKMSTKWYFNFRTKYFNTIILIL